MANDLDEYHAQRRQLAGNIAAAKQAIIFGCEQGEEKARRLLRVGFVDESYLIMLYRERQAFLADIGVIASVLDAYPSSPIVAWVGDSINKLVNDMGEYHDELAAMVGTEDFKQAEAAADAQDALALALQEAQNNIPPLEQPRWPFLRWVALLGLCLLI